MDVLIDTARNLVIYLIFTTIIKNLIGSSGYIKYAEFFMGIIMILILVNPIVSLLHLDGNIEQYINFNQIYYETKDAPDELYVGEDVVNDAILSDASTKFEEQIESIAKKEGIDVSECIVTLSGTEDTFGNIQRVDIWTGTASEGIAVEEIRIGTPKEDELKNQNAEYAGLIEQITNVYGVKEDSVFIY